MLIQVGQERSVAIDLRLALYLSFVAGTVNAAGFRAMGYFSANMTGNLSTLSDVLALGQVRIALWFFLLIVSFVTGAFLSGLLIEIGQARRFRGIYALSILLEAILLLGLALVDMLVLSSATEESVTMLGLSLLMGLQNAATTRISDARVRTSHVSGIATDLGLGLATLLNRSAMGDPTRRSIVYSRLILHLSTLLAFFVGGVTGVLGYERIGPGVYMLAALILLTIAVPALGRSIAESPTQGGSDA